MLVRSRHHTLIHTRGFHLVLHPDRRLTVATADGIPVLHHPVQPWGKPAELATGAGRGVCAGTLAPDRCDARMDLGYVVRGDGTGGVTQQPAFRLATKHGLTPTRQAIGQHLHVLDDAGLVQRRREGRYTFHSYDPTPLRQVFDRWRLDDPEEDRQ